LDWTLNSVGGPDGAATLKKRKHVLITGVGRSGTSFLVQLLTELGFDTGYTPSHLPLHPECRAGLEHDIREEDAPYVVKNPWFCDYAEEVLRRPEIELEHVFIPVRNLNAAAESRRAVERSVCTGSRVTVKSVPGGLWHTKIADEQEDVLALQLYRLMHALSAAQVNITLLHHPRLVHDSRYLQTKLKPMLGASQIREFDRAFQKVRNPAWIHQFNDADALRGPPPA
jgi:hypothetical protein